MHLCDHSIKLLIEVHYDRLSNSTVPSPLRIKAYPLLNPKHILPATATTTPTMIPHVKALVFILLLLIVSSFSGEQVLFVFQSDFHSPYLSNIQLAFVSYRLR